MLHCCPCESCSPVDMQVLTLTCWLRFLAWPWRCLIVVDVPGDLDARMNLTTMSRLFLLTLFRYHETASVSLALSWSLTPFSLFLTEQVALVAPYREKDSKKRGVQSYSIEAGPKKPNIFLHQVIPAKHLVTSNWKKQNKTKATSKQKTTKKQINKQKLKKNCHIKLILF